MQFFESLEPRVLRTSTISMDGYGQLAVTSDLYADIITVKEQFGSATVTVNKIVRGTFNGVSRVVINGGGGKDVITYTGYSVGADICGEDGADTIKVYDYRPDSGHDYGTVSGGYGIDKIYVYAGYNMSVHGNADADGIYVYGGTGASVWGDGGIDTVSVASTAATNTTIYKELLDKVSNKGTGTVITLV